MKTFFSFAVITDPTKHRAYNEWHQLDHRPENLALPGVRWGERWVRTPQCAGHGTAAPALADTHYVNMYWFNEPARESVVEWQRLAEISFQWGRRPEMPWTARPLMGFFDAVKGYVAPRVLVSAEVVPLRPNRGVHIEVLELDDAHGRDAHELHRWYDQVALPTRVGLDGVAGAWSFTSESTTFDTGFAAAHDSRTFAPAESQPGRVRIHLTWCDGDPVDVTAAIDAWHADVATPVTPARALLTGPLRGIQPWEWDWFDPPR